MSDEARRIRREREAERSESDQRPVGQPDGTLPGDAVLRDAPSSFRARRPSTSSLREITVGLAKTWRIETPTTGALR